MAPINLPPGKPFHTPSLLLIVSIIVQGFCTTAFSANYNVVFKPYSPIVFSSKDLWNIDVINLTPSPSRVKIIVTFTGQRSKQLVRSEVSVYTLQQGANTLSFASLKPAIHYYDNTIKASEMSVGTFPAGTYEHCVEVLPIGQPIELGNNNCQNVQIELMNPPILVSPENRAAVQTNNPVLTWLPPMPVASGVEITYRLTLTEMLANQTAFEALKRNRYMF